MPRASSTVGVGGGAGVAVAAGADALSVVDGDPRPLPTERETVIARWPNMTSVALTIALASAVGDAAAVSG